MDIKCGTCDTDGFFLRQKGNATGAYCASCGKWIKWVGKADINVLKRRGHVVHSEGYEPVLKAVEPPVHTTRNYGVIEDDPFNTVATPANVHTSVPELNKVVPKESNSFGAINPFDRQTGRAETVEVLDCSVCKFGVLDTIDQVDGIEHNIFGGVLTFTETETSTILGAYKMSYCPCCGRKL